MCTVCSPIDCNTVHIFDFHNSIQYLIVTIPLFFLYKLNLSL